MVKSFGGALIVAMLVAGCTSNPGIEGTHAPTNQAVPSLTAAPPEAYLEVPTVIPAPCTASLTPAQTEGPYYTAGSPERSNLAEPGIPGTPLLVTGLVMAEGCEPIAGARVDFWQADGAGEYDNVGYQMRGHQLTEPDGSYRLETVIPGVYPGRTPHIHIKIFAPDGRELLTTQLYLRGISDQISDGFFDAALLASDEAPDSSGRRHVSFDFVVGR
jgi:protocatechuate 3,4-dioxygenase beta subunit